MRVFLQAVVLAAVLESVRSQFENIMGEAQSCPPFTCSGKDEVPVQKRPIKVTSSGCDSLSGNGRGNSMNMMNMNNGKKSITDALVSPCCDLMHACLQTCGTKNKFCSSDAKKCMMVKCETLQEAGDKEGFDKCKSDIEMKNLMIQFGGCGVFNKGQQDNCKCVNKSRLDKERKEALSSFYKKHNPKDAHKAEALASKVENSNQFAGLLYKLYKKYPKSIKIVKDPQQQMMENLMRDMEKQDLEKNDQDVGDEDAGDDSETDDEVYEL